MPSCEAGNIRPRMITSLWEVTKLAIDETVIHFPKCRISLKWAAFHFNAIRGPATAACDMTNLTTLDATEPITRAQAFGKHHAAANMIGSVNTFPARSTYTNGFKFNRLAFSPSVADSKPAKIRLIPNAAVIHGNKGSAKTLSIGKRCRMGGRLKAIQMSRRTIQRMMPLDPW